MLFIYNISLLRLGVSEQRLAFCVRCFFVLIGNVLSILTFTKEEEKGKPASKCFCVAANLILLISGLYKGVSLRFY